MNDTSKFSASRDVRLDLFRGVANWTIFVDRIPNNAVAWLTARNYSLSGAADLFVFVSGNTATFVYLRYMRARGFLVGSFLLFGRFRQIHVAYVLLFVAYLTAIGFVAETYDHSHLLDEFNVRHLLNDPIETLKHGLLPEFLLELVSGSLASQVLIGVAGIAIMTGVAHYRIWTTGLRSYPLNSNAAVQTS